MSDDTNETKSAQPQKGREPEFDLVQMTGEGEQTRFFNIGALWKSSKSENLVGESVHGRVLVKPRVSKSDLEALRAEQAQTPSQSQDEGISY